MPKQNIRKPAHAAKPDNLYNTFFYVAAAVGAGALLFA